MGALCIRFSEHELKARVNAKVQSAVGVLANNPSEIRNPPDSTTFDA